MAKGPNKTERREATHILGEMAASRLFSTIHERLEELNDREGITQGDIAQRLGVSEQLVSHWLLEPRNMTVRSAGRLIGAMDAHLLFELDRFENMGGGNSPVSAEHAIATAVTIMKNDAELRRGPVTLPTSNIKNIGMIKILDDTNDV